MTFEGQYLTYDEYINLADDSSMEEMPFNLLEFEARKQIDEATQFRLVGLKNIPNEVKICEYKVINKIQDYAKSIAETENKNVANESIDGYSVTYITLDKIGEIIKSKKEEIQDAIRTYLLGVIVNGEHILYAGIK